MRQKKVLLLLDMTAARYHFWIFHEYYPRQLFGWLCKFQAYALTTVPTVQPEGASLGKFNSNPDPVLI